MVPQQLACPKCGCLLAHIDTDVRRECPNCAHAFTADAPPVWPSTTPKEDHSEANGTGCAMLTFLLLVFAQIDPDWLRWTALGLIIGLHVYLTRVRGWPANRVVLALTVASGLLLLAELFVKLRAR